MTMRRLLAVISLLSLLLLSSCKTQYVTVEKEVPIEKVRVEYKTNIKYDSIYIHDSINTYIIGDTIYKTQTLLRYKYKFITDTIHKVDSIDKPVYITKTVTKEVTKKSKPKDFLCWSGLIAWGLFILFLTRKIKNKIKI